MRIVDKGFLRLILATLGIGICTFYIAEGVHYLRFGPLDTFDHKARSVIGFACAMLAILVSLPFYLSVTLYRAAKFFRHTPAVSVFATGLEPLEKHTNLKQECC